MNRKIATKMLAPDACIDMLRFAKSIDFDTLYRKDDGCNNVTSVFRVRSKYGTKRFMEEFLSELKSSGMVSRNILPQNEEKALKFKKFLHMRVDGTNFYGFISDYPCIASGLSFQVFNIPSDLKSKKEYYIILEEKRRFSMMRNLSA